jgi:hypothetical protein
VIALTVLFLSAGALFGRTAFADGGAPNLAYISGTPGGVSVLDVGQGKVTKTLALAGDPHMILLSLDGRVLYVTQPALGRVAAIAAASGQTICSTTLPGHPSALALSQDGSVLYAGGEGGTGVAAIDTANCHVRQTYTTGGSVYGIWAMSGGTPGSKSGQVWATGPSSISIFDVQGSLLKTIPVAGGPMHLCIPPTGTTAYVTTRSGSVDVIDLKTWNMQQMLSGGVYGTMDYDALTLEAYVPDTLHHVIDVLAPPTGAATPVEPVRVYHTMDAPTSVAVTNDGLFGFFALQGGRVEVFDLIDRDPVYTVTVGGSPQFVITGLYPPTQVVPQPTTITVGTSPTSSTGGQFNPMLIVVPVLLILLGGILLMGVLYLVGRTSKRR